MRQNLGPPLMSEIITLHMRLIFSSSVLTIVYESAVSKIDELEGSLIEIEDWFSMTSTLHSLSS